MILTTFLTTAILASLPVGYEIDAKSWQKGKADTITVTLVTTAGKVNGGCGARLDMAATAEPLDLQIGLVALLEEEGWDVRPGPDYTVRVFAPKGQSVRSIKIESDVWVPKFKRILAPFPEPKK